MPRVFVKPGTAQDGSPLVVRDPVTRLPIAAQGQEVELDKTIRRRLFDGDLVKVEPSAPAGSESALEQAPDVDEAPVADAEEI